MKKIIITLIIAASLISLSNNANAQAWHRGAKAFSFGLGGTYYWHLADYYTGYSPLLGILIVQGEFGVHDYVGVGFTTGLAFRGSNRFGWGAEIGLPIGAIGNFHFWQLIDDKVSSDLHSDKLDIYGGINIGSGLAFLPQIDDVSAIFFVGPQVGARYYFTPNFGVMAEFGYGKSWLNAGIVIKSGN